MPSKEEIFDNITAYTAEQIVGFIRQRIVSVSELEDSENTGGDYSCDMRDKVNELLNTQEQQGWQDTKVQQENQEQVAQPTDDWSFVDKGSLSALQAYVKAHPDSPYIREAKRLINKIKNIQDVDDLTGVDMKALIKIVQNIQADKKVINPDEVVYNKVIGSLNRENGITIEELIQAITDDKNLLSSGVIHKLFNEGHLTKQDFVTMGIDRAFVQYMLEDVRPQQFDSPEPLTCISKPSTEIYFWGIPSSGKSCALGGILSVASNGKVASHLDKDNHCQGYGYMSRLMVQFKSDGSVGTLPEGTSLVDTYEMGFDLIDMDGLIHPITCVDLAGEMIRCMFKFDSDADMREEELLTLDTLTKILVDNRTQNRKMHFFVIEYGADDRYYEGLPQKTYLEAAVQYIRNFEIFKRDTDAIFILVSKVDKVPNDKDRNEAIKEYLETNYRGFIAGLKSICKENEINGGDIEVIPFSLGTVCFQNYCRFNEDAAELVVRKIIERSVGYKQDKFNKILRKLKG